MTPLRGGAATFAGLGLGLVLATAWVYSPVGDFGFVSYDDPEYVAENKVVRQGIGSAGLRWALRNPHHGNWHPLTSLSHMLDVEVFGLEPGAMHRVNVGLHLLNVLLLFALLWRATRSCWRSAAVAALFALHPLHVESVVWISERKDVLSTALALATAHAYLSYVRSPCARRYLLVLLLFAAGLLAKPMLVTWPFVLLLLDVWPLRRFDSVVGAERAPRRALLVRALLEKLPLFALSCILSVVALWAQRSGGALKSTELHPLGERLANAVVSYVAYLRKSVWPTDLAVLYPYPESLSGWQVVGSAALLIAVTVACLRLRRRRPHAIVGWLWYLGTLVPVIGIVQVGAQPYADRYTYIPLIGLFIAVVWGLGGVVESRRRLLPAAAVLAGVALVALSLLASRQVAVWQDSVSLYQHALRVTEKNAILYNNLGIALVDQWRYDEAIRVYAQGLAFRSDFMHVLHYNAGIAESRVGGHAEALVHFDGALRLDPGYEEVLFHKARSLAALGRLEEARQVLARVVELAPATAEPQVELGLVLGKLGAPALARQHFARALEIQPSHVDARINLAIAYLKTGDPEAATQELEQVLRLSPGHDAAAHYLEEARSQRDRAVSDRDPERDG
jgi:tetratricopeptide (TPR) repeat protein